MAIVDRMLRRTMGALFVSAIAFSAESSTASEEKSENKLMIKCTYSEESFGSGIVSGEKVGFSKARGGVIFIMVGVDGYSTNAKIYDPSEMTTWEMEPCFYWEKPGFSCSLDQNIFKKEWDISEGGFDFENNRGEVIRETVGSRIINRINGEYRYVSKITERYRLFVYTRSGHRRLGDASGISGVKTISRSGTCEKAEDPLASQAHKF